MRLLYFCLIISCIYFKHLLYYINFIKVKLNIRLFYWNHRVRLIFVYLKDIPPAEITINCISVVLPLIKLKKEMFNKLKND